MIAKRIIPHFLLRGQRLAKGKNFKDFKDVGAPLSQAMIYDAQGAEEIIVVDIEAGAAGRTIPPSVITSMITHCRLPIAAGGGIGSIEDAQACFAAGADKVTLNTRGVADPKLVSVLAREFGAQSVVASLDVKKTGDGKHMVLTRSGTFETGIELVDCVKRMIDHGAGELVVTSIDREGTLSGFDLEIYAKIRPITPVPLIAAGGAGRYDDIVELFRQTDCDGCALGKMLFLRDYDIVRIKSYLHGKGVLVRDA